MNEENKKKKIEEETELWEKRKWEKEIKEKIKSERWSW